MPLGTASHTVTFWTMLTEDDLIECWKVLPSIKYHGDLSDWFNEDTQQAEHVLMANGDSPQQKNIRAVIGDVMIWNGTTLSVITDDEFNASYTVISGS